MQICKQCQHTNADEATFCSRCGSHLKGQKNPLIDRIIDKYRLKEKIGGGGFGMVYRAEHVTLANPFAIKLLHPHLIHNDMMVQRFRQEAMLLATLRHENIVQVIDFGNVEGMGFYLVMEWLEGKTFQWHLKREGPPPLDKLLQIFEQLLDALQYAHDKGVVHRDLKPENLMLIPGNRGRRTLKILDFGIARMMDSREEKRLTETGIAVGTPRYMSPEQAAGDVHLIDHRTDLYACGVLLVELLTGKQLFSGSTNEILIHHMDTPAPSLRELAPNHNYPPDLEDVIAKALAKDREDRFQSADDFTNALFEAFSADPTAISQEIYSPRASQYTGSIQRYIQPEEPQVSTAVPRPAPQLAPTSPPLPPQSRHIPSADPSAITRTLSPNSVQPHPEPSLSAQSQHFLGEQSQISSSSQLRSKSSSSSQPPTQNSNLTRWMWVAVGLMSGLMLVLLFFVLASFNSDPKRQQPVPPPTAENQLPLPPREIPHLQPQPPRLPALPQPQFHSKPRSLALSFYNLIIIPETPELTVIIDGKKLLGSPPWQLKIPKNKTLQITFSKKGYITQVVEWTALQNQILRPSLKKKIHFKKRNSRRKLYRRKYRRYVRRKKSRHRRRRRYSSQKTVLLTLKTVPTAAIILIDGVYRGKTPLKIRSRQGQRIKVFVKKKGYLSKWFYWSALKNQTKIIHLAEDIF